MGPVWRITRRAIRSVIRPLGFDIVRFRRASNHIEAITAASQGRAIRMIIDVGANVGQTALAFHHHFAEATIHALEPYEEAYAELVRRTHTMDRVIAHRSGLGDSDRTDVLHVNQRSVTNSLLSAVPQTPDGGVDHDMTPVGSAEVEIQRLDTFCRGQGIASIDVLKIDTQGYELHVLEGAGAMLAPATIRMVYLEVLFVPLYQGQADFQAIHERLATCGYKLYDLFEAATDLSHGLRWANALFIPAGPGS